MPLRFVKHHFHNIFNVLFIIMVSFDTIINFVLILVREPLGDQETDYFVISGIGFYRGME